MLAHKECSDIQYLINGTQMSNYDVITSEGSVPIKSWTRGVIFEEQAKQQLRDLAKMPFVYKHVAVMPDVHAGIGSTVGSVIATRSAIIPASVGVDIGCGMSAIQTSLTASDLPDSLADMRSAIERAVPHGRTNNGGAGDRGAWENVPSMVVSKWLSMCTGYDKIIAKHPRCAPRTAGTVVSQLCSLGGGNHFIEVCLDENDQVWIMLHSGSRGVGNRIGSYFIELAKEDMRVHHINLPDKDLAYLSEGTTMFSDYLEAVGWAQEYALINRELMMHRTLSAVRDSVKAPFQSGSTVVSCHHNYVSKEPHFGEDVLVTRKGAVRARAGEMGIIPGSMGTKSYIVRGKGNPESFQSCSHGAGRAMSRTEAKKRFTLEDHAAATAGVECRKDEEVLDETPGAYKPVEAVIAAQADLIDIVHTLRAVLCVKG